ncbi:MAG: hypothetical protein ACTHOR_17660 [Devosia sp.]
MPARAETAEQRHAIYRGLAVRNRLIGILRIGLPLLAVLVLVAFFVQIFIASFVNQFGVAQVSFNGDTVEVDTPTYSGVTSDGDVYKISAEGASTAVTSLNIIDLRNGELVVTRPDGVKMTAKAALSSFDTNTQILTVAGRADVDDSTGNSGTLEKITVNVPQQTLHAAGPVHLVSKDGTTIDSNGLDYSTRTGVWNFGKATMTVPGEADGNGGAGT